MAGLSPSGAGKWCMRTAESKKFETEFDARQYLTRCDAAGKIIHRGDGHGLVRDLSA